jgi:hypothetical protein
MKKNKKQIIRWREEHAPKHCVKVPTATRSLCFNNVLMETIAGSNPVLITEGANPETWKDKVGDSWKDSKYGSIASVGRS